MATEARTPARRLNRRETVLWSLQLLLALGFGLGGAFKLLAPLDVLARMFVWVPVVPPELVRLVGFSELAGGIGVALPWALRIKPVLTPLAAIGLVVVMLLAAGFHLARGEYGYIMLNAVFATMAAAVAWGRLRDGAPSSG